MSPKMDNLTKAGYVYHAIASTENSFRRRLRIPWRLYTIFLLLSQKDYSFKEKVRVLRVGADKNNRYVERVFNYKYELLKPYYDNFIKTEDFLATASASGATREDIRCLFAVLAEILVNDYYAIDILVKPADKVVDVGANIGAYAVAIKEAFPDSDILAFEPSHDTYATLELNLRGYTQVSLNNSALGDTSGTKELVVAHNILLNAISDTVGSDMKIDPIRRESVTMERLDSYLDFAANVVKLDIEGYESAALRGGAEFIRRNSPLIVCACDHSAKQRFELVATMREIAPQYLTLNLNEANICFYLDELHHDRVSSFLPADSARI